LGDIKERAEVLRILALAGFVKADAIVAWADGVIIASDSPGREIIEVSLGGSKSTAELVQVLAAIPGVSCKNRIASAILHQMAAVVYRDYETARRIASMLSQMEIDGIVPNEHARAQMRRLDDAFALAESGAWGRREEVLDELVEFISAWGENPA
jgi:hypothetical protein